MDIRSRHDRIARVREIQSWLEARGVTTLGRFGAWEYVNSDKCIHHGLALGRSIAEQMAPVARGLIT